MTRLMWCWWSGSAVITRASGRSRIIAAKAPSSSSALRTGTGMRVTPRTKAAAAEMSMEELHEKRGAYVRRVREAAAEDLTKNGLELESVSLTQLDQTSMEFFNPSNAFDAEGLTRLTETIEQRKKQRNDVEQDTLIAIRNKNLEAEKLSLEIDREGEYARLSQQREVEIAHDGSNLNAGISLSTSVVMGLIVTAATIVIAVRALSSFSLKGDAI